jgi:ethanolamine transporter EutH
MLLRLRLALGSVMGAVVVALAVCLGAQNLSDRPTLQLGVARTAPLPSGFLMGLALAAGLLSGGSAAAVAFGRSDDDGAEPY